MKKLILLSIILAGIYSSCSRIDRIKQVKNQASEQQMCALHNVSIIKCQFYGRDHPKYRRYNVYACWIDVCNQRRYYIRSNEFVYDWKDETRRLGANRRD